MNFIIYALFAAAAAVSPKVEISSLDGKLTAGRLTGLTADEVTIDSDGQPRNVPLAELMQIRFSESTQPGQQSSGIPRVTLIDGSQFGATAAESTATTFTVNTPHLGQFSLPLTSVANVRLAPTDRRVEEAWAEIAVRQVKQDLLVVRKGDVLDHLPGVVGVIGKETLAFILDGQEISVPVAKVFGIVYGRTKRGRFEPVCRAELANADLLNLNAISQADGALAAVLVDGTTVTIPIDQVSRLDFSHGKLRYLSDMEPREVKYTPFFDITWKYRRNTNLDGGPLRVGRKEYARGISIHSRTMLRYRLSREFRRFQAVVGIDRVVGRNGDVQLVISGDGKVLFEENIRGVDDPRALDLDVSGVHNLEILVDFGGDLDIADHLDLADAKLVK